MADGTVMPIEDVEPGDMVWAADPDSGWAGPAEVTHVWVHGDELIDLATTSGRVTTTHDHRFYNHTDQTWQTAADLDGGDLLSTPTLARVIVVGLDPASTHTGPAYNLTVAGVHTYHVTDGTHPTLVHNCNPRLTGTVWDDVVATGGRYAGTEVPTSFRLTAGGSEVWVHPNVTEHLAERVLRAGTNGPITTQSQIRSLQAAIADVAQGGLSPGRYDIGGWALEFSQRAGDELIVLNHGFYHG